MYRVNPLIENVKTTAYTTPVDNPPPVYKASCLVSECPYGASPKAIEAYENMRKMALTEYPHKKAVVAQAIAEYWQDVTNLTAGNVIPGEGSVDIMFKINRLFLTNPDAKALLGIEPQFLAYHNDLLTYPVRYDTYNLTKENGYKVEIEKLEKMLKPEHVLVYINNPNNPTGQIIPLPDIERMIVAAKNNGTCIIIDEAYGDYMDKAQSAATLLHKYDNLIVMRSFSKGFGLAGIRAAYLLVPTWFVGAYNNIATPYCMNAIAQELVLASLQDKQWVPSIRKKVNRDKTRIIEALPKQIRVAETNNDVPIMLAYVEDMSLNLQHYFAKFAINVVTGTSYIGLEKNAIRICLTENIEDLLEALAEMKAAMEG